MEVNESLKNFDVEVIPAEQQQTENGYKRFIQRKRKGAGYFGTKYLSPR